MILILAAGVLASLFHCFSARSIPDGQTGAFAVVSIFTAIAILQAPQTPPRGRWSPCVPYFHSMNGSVLNLSSLLAPVFFAKTQPSDIRPARSDIKGDLAARARVIPAEYSVLQLAELFGASLLRVKSWIERGLLIPVVNRGGHSVFTRRAVAAFVRSGVGEYCVARVNREWFKVIVFGSEGEK